MDIQVTIEGIDRSRVASLLAGASAAIEGEARIASSEGHGDRARLLWSEADRLARLVTVIRNGG